MTTEPAATTDKRPRVLFLDDDPGRAEVFLAEQPHAIWVQTAADCIVKLSEPWDEIHLDHDLGGEHFVDTDRDDCGMAVVRWIVETPREHLKTTRFLIHSHNVNAATVMGFQLTMSGFHTEVRPFGVPSVDLPSETDSSLTGILGTISRLLRRIFPREEKEDYGYVEYHRENPELPEAPPPEKLDFSWMRTPPPEPETSPPAD